MNSVPMPDPAPVAAPLGHPVWCDVTELALLAFDGPDAQAFLQGQLSNDVTALDIGRSQWTSYNSPKGRMLASLLLWQSGPQSYRALAASDLVATLVKRLSMYVLRAKVKVADLSASFAVIGLGGPGADGVLRAALGAAPRRGEALDIGDATAIGLPDGRIVVVTPAAGAVASRLTGHAAHAQPDVWRWLGVRAGVPLIGAATQDLFVPQTANWDLIGGVNFQKGCYPGQEIVARTQYLGRLKERLQLFHADGAPPAPATRLFGEAFGDQACGMVVNAAPAGGGGCDLLAVVQLAALAAPPLRLHSATGPALTPMPLPYVVPDPVAPERPKL